MKIKQTIDRECCHYSDDLREYKGEKIMDNPSVKYQFCIHCGQLWCWYRAPGDLDAGPTKVTILATSP